VEFRTLALVCCLVLAGCSAPISDRGDGSFEWPEDPPSDRLGWENGYWYNESIDVDQSDGLDEAERERLVARTMARVEVIRGLEFEKTVPVSVVSREEFQSRERDTTVDSPREQFDEQVWEALFLVGENRTFGEVRAELYGGSVLGFYSPANDRIVIVSDSETPTIDRATLAHELMHALQDQHFSLLGGADSRDEQLARQGVSEGDANYVEALYEERCAAGAAGGNASTATASDSTATANESTVTSTATTTADETATQDEGWDCIDRPDRSSAGQISESNLGVYLTVIFPYSDGPGFVHQIRERGGWAAVNALYDQPPQSAEQLIHPGAYPDDDPARMGIPDRSDERWSRYSLDQQSQRLGEASVFAMFWYQQTVDRSSIRDGTGAYSTYNYSAPPSAGWAGDTLVPYRTEAGADGYVWRLQWDTRQDAQEFVDAYQRLLTDQLGAREVREGVYRVPDESAYGDAFRVARNGRTVTIVNAPRVAGLDAIHPPAE
jgi:hypothetical protein